MAETSIEWAGKVWNPLRGCSRKSSGCEKCYAERVAHRFSGPGQPYEGLTRLTKKGPVWTGEVRTVPENLSEPLRWRKPAKIFVNSMSDLFHEDVPFEFIAAVFGVMAAAREHTFQVLTKRPERMPLFFEWLTGEGALGYTWQTLYGYARAAGVPKKLLRGRMGSPWPWPLPNVWLGTSCEDQATADARIPELLRCPAAVRWVSAEPLLGPIDFGEWIQPWTCCDNHYERRVIVKGDLAECPECGSGDYAITAWGDAQRDRWESGERYSTPEGDLDVAGEWVGPHWIVVGGESGHGARPCDLAWIGSIVEQCEAANVACFVKQLGSAPTAGRIHGGGYPSTVTPLRVKLKNKKGGDPAEWPADLRVRQYPEARHG